MRTHLQTSSESLQPVVEVSLVQIRRRACSRLSRLAWSRSAGEDVGDDVGELAASCRGRRSLEGDGGGCNPVCGDDPSSSRPHRRGDHRICTELEVCGCLVARDWLPTLSPHLLRRTSWTAQRVAGGLRVCVKVGSSAARTWACWRCVFARALAVGSSVSLDLPSPHHLHLRRLWRWWRGWSPEPALGRSRIGVAHPTPSGPNFFPPFLCSFLKEACFHLLSKAGLPALRLDHGEREL